MEYKSEHVKVYWGDAFPEEMERLIGSTVESIESYEYELTIRFSGGKVLSVTGSRWDGCSLGVDLEEEL